MAIFTALVVAIGWGGTFVGAVIVSALKIAAGLVLNKLAMRLAGKKASGPTFSVKGQLDRGADLPQSFLLGKSATAGSLVYVNEWGSDGGTPNAFFTMVVALSDLPVGSLNGVWVNGERGTIGSEAHSEYGYPVAEFNRGDVDHLWVKFYDGRQTVADAFLTGTVSSEDRPWSEGSVGFGVAYAVVTARINRELFSGFPQVIFELTGMRLYDPSRDSSVGGAGDQRWADPLTWGGDGDHLPAVQVYNLMRGLRLGDQWVYGMQLGATEQLPVSHWISQIEKCRAPILAQDGHEPRFRAGGEISINAQIADAIEALLESCMGRITESGGVYKIFVGAPDQPVAAISDADILSTEEQSFTPFFGLADTVNGISAKFPDPDQVWQVETAPPLNRDDYEAEDGGRRLMVDIQFDLVPYAEQVQRLMRANLREARRARRHTFVLPPRFWSLEPGDVIRWTSARNGYDDKRFRVDGVFDQPNADVVVDITEVDPTDYDFDTNVDFTPVTRGSIINPEDPVHLISGFGVEAATVRDDSGVDRLPAIKVFWNGAVDDVSAVQITVRDEITQEVVFSGRFDSVSVGSGLVAMGLVPDNRYQVRGKYIPRGRRKTDWSSWLSVTTPDVRLRLTDLADDVANSIEAAQSAADDAATDATQALADAAAVQSDHNALTIGFTGTIANAVANLDQAVADARADAERAVAALGVSVLRLPRSDWSRDVHLGADMIKPPMTTGTFVTDDPDFGECFEFGGVYNATVGHSHAFEFDPSRIYKVTYRFKAVSDGASGGVRVLAGVTTQAPTALVESNVQASGPFDTGNFLAVAAGVQEASVYVSGDAAALTDYGLPAAQQIGLGSSGGASKAFFHLRQNAGGSTDGILRVAAIEVRDVTEAVAVANALRTELASEIDGVNANLTTNYYTITQAGSAIAAATTSLQSAMEAPTGSIGALSANLTQNYYTATQTDGAISAAVTTLDASIATLADAAAGWQLVLDGVAVGSAGASVSAQTGGAAIGQGGTVVVTEGASTRETGGATSGFQITVPAAQALQFGSRRVRIAVLARAPSANAATRFGIAYSTSDTGNSGYMLADRDLTTGWQWFTFYWDVTAPNGGGTDYVGLYGDDMQSGLATEFSRVVIEAATEADELPEIASLTGEITDIKALEVSGSTAFGTLMQQLDVNAAGTSATITNHASAVADMNGFSNAFAGLNVSTNGGNIAGFTATSWSNPDGTGGAVLGLLGDVIAEKSIATNRLTVGLGRNIIENADFLQGSASINYLKIGTVGSGAITEVRHDDSDYAKPFYPTCRLQSVASVVTNSGAVSAQFKPTDVNGGLGVGYAVEPGEYYEFTAALNARRVNYAMDMIWHDSNGTQVGSDRIVDLSKTGTDSTGGGLQSWVRRGGIRQAPATAAYCVPDARIIGVAATTGITDLHIFQPMFCKTEEGAALTPYSPGGTTLIDGGRIVANSVTSAQITAGTVTAANINTQDFKAAGAGVFGGEIKSDNFNAGNTGWRIMQDGSAEFNGPVISRDIVLNEGTFQPGFTVTDGTQFLFVNSGIRMGVNDVWSVSKHGVIISAAITSGGTAPGGFDPNNTYWGLDAYPITGARWNGLGGTAPAQIWQRNPASIVDWPDKSGTSQRLLFNITVHAQGGVYFPNPTIKWKIFLVT